MTSQRAQTVVVSLKGSQYLPFRPNRLLPSGIADEENLLARVSQLVNA